MRDKIILIFLISSEIITYLNPFLGATFTKLIFYSILLLLYISKYFFLKHHKFRFKKDFFFFSFTIYILAYLFRLIIDLYLNNIFHTIYNDKFTYIFLFFNAIILPFIFLRTVNYDKLDFSTIHRVLTMLLAISVLFSFYRLVTEGIIAVQIDSGRISANENLDPIAFGHLGVSLFLIALHNFNNYRSSIIRWLLNISLCCIGLLSLAMSNSRGPVVALLFVLIIYLIIKKKVKIFAFLSLTFAFILFYIEVINDFLKSYGSTFVDRIINSLSFTNIENISSGRSTIFNLAIDKIIENPLFGDSLLLQDDSFRGQYYHNFVLESFVGLGVLFGCLYLVIIIKSMSKAFTLLKINTKYYFISFLFFQHLIYSMFSRSVLNLPLFWVSLFLVNYIYESNKLSNKITV